MSYFSQGGLYISYLSRQYIYGIGRPNTDYFTHRRLLGKRAKMFGKYAWPVCGAKPHSSCTNVCLQISHGEMNNAINITNFWKQHSHWTEPAWHGSTTRDASTLAPSRSETAAAGQVTGLQGEPGPMNSLHPGPTMCLRSREAEAQEQRPCSWFSGLKPPGAPASVERGRPDQL